MSTENILLVESSRIQIRFPNYYEGKSGLPMEIRFGDKYRVGIIGKYIVGYIDQAGMVRPFLSCHPKTGKHQWLKIQIRTPTSYRVERILQDEFDIKAHFNHYYPDEGMLVKEAERPWPHHY